LAEQHSAIESTDRSLHPEFRSEQQTLRLRVEAAIAELPIEIREPFILREFDGFSYVEIAEQLSITHGAVRQRIYRAKQAMRGMLADLIEDDEVNELSISEDERGSADSPTAKLQRNKDHGNV
jgi:DNA-directed RNA polymerase specialized sigma24 family protein